MRAESATEIEESQPVDPTRRPGVSGAPLDADEWVVIGRVSRAHGLAGAVVVVLYGEESTNLCGADSLRLSLGSRSQEFSRLRSSPVPAAGTRRARVRLWLDGIATRTGAEAWAGADLAIPAHALGPLPEGEYYCRDLIGLHCQTLAGRALGTIEEIWPTGSNDVLVVRDGSRSILIPALYHVIVEVDIEAGRVRVDPPEGLLDAEDEELT